MIKFISILFNQVQTLFVFVLFIAFIYFPNLNDEINLLPFQIDHISWREAWYYIIIFVLVWFFIYFRVSVSKKLYDRISLKELVVWDLLIMTLGIPFFFIPFFDEFGLLMISFSLLLVAIDILAFKLRSGYVYFIYVVAVLFLFSNNILLFVYWQNDYKMVGYSHTLVNDYRVDGNWQDFIDNGWSLAKYSGTTLVAQEGDFSYPLYNHFKIDREGLNNIRIREQIEHFVYSYDGDVYLVSLPTWSPFYLYVVNLTYLFALYLAISFLIYYIFYLRNIYNASSFFSRFQRTLTSFLVGSMIVVFVVAAFLIKVRYERTACYNQQYRMQFLVEYLMSDISLCSNCESVLSEDVPRLASMMEANISLYDKNGNLLISSGDRIDVPDNIADLKGLPFTDMPSAFYARIVDVNRVPVVRSYAILNDVNHSKVYVMMSSKAEIVKLKRNLALFFVLVFNLFFLTMIVTSFISYIISRRLSAPLSLLEKKMSAIELGGDNDKIDFPMVEGDVLSKLVAQYNSMIDKLAVSVEELAQSEREASWRQMARQMAHEIKNPLTPMQLLTQRLLMQSSDNLQEYKEAVHTSAKALLQGIESITTTTDALSNFAKKPISPLEPIDIVESVRYAVNLFRNNEADVNIDFSSTLDSAMVLVDKEMIGNVFNNLLKNAIQAIPEGRKGEVSVKVYHNVKSVMISIADNGVGIPEENRDKLYIVNFTTKTKGMGLGLMVVKNVVEQANGDIEFHSEVGEGTTFVVSFPLIQS